MSRLIRRNELEGIGRERRQEGKREKKAESGVKV
jgi:hypothetical protein